LHLEDEVRRAQKLVELKERQDRERIAALQRQVTRLEAALASVRGQADFDTLTGVYHRGVFDQRLQGYLEAENPCTLALIDVDNFKTINDTLGHTVGDRILALLGENIHRVARSTDLAARYGGDEFAFVAVGFTAEQIAQRLSGAVARRHVRMELDEGERIIQVLLSTSVGITTSRRGDTPHSLIQRSDQAMLAAKKAGKGGLRIAL
ncbi:MAG TPA: GGDEF domain-containing protein, partial [Armatimonadota bacterium]|nr:GGDEF domain-containing protein [Armatimonadota bacterium]